MMRVSARDLRVRTDQLGDGSPAALLIASCEHDTGLVAELLTQALHASKPCIAM
jgi:hypothetical protein